MTHCIVSLVQAAFEHVGRSDAPASELDRHAPIEIQFEKAPSICIEKSDNDDVVFYSNLSESAFGLAARNTSETLGIVSQKAAWARYHAVSLLDDDGELYLTAIVADTCLRDGAGFSSAMEGFYQRVCALCGVEPT